MQVWAAFPELVAAVKNQPVPPDLQNTSICLVYLKKLIPAVAQRSSRPSHALLFPRNSSDSNIMTSNELSDFTSRIASHSDPQYRVGGFADPSDVLRYILLILPVAATFFSFEIKATLKSSCACGAHERRVYSYHETGDVQSADAKFQLDSDETERRKANELCLKCFSLVNVPQSVNCPLHQRGTRQTPLHRQNTAQYYPLPKFQIDTDITLVLRGKYPMIHHIIDYFAQVFVCGYDCQLCQFRSTEQHPAVQQRFLLSLPTILMVTISEPLGPDGLPPNHHHYGPLQDFEKLDLSCLIMQQPTVPCHSHYTLHAAIMYSHRHHWTYLPGPPATYISDSINRLATPEDFLRVAESARVLIYTQDIPVQPNAVHQPVVIDSPLSKPHILVSRKLHDKVEEVCALIHENNLEHAINVLFADTDENLNYYANDIAPDNSVLCSLHGKDLTPDMLKKCVPPDTAPSNDDEYPACLHSETLDFALIVFLLAKNAIQPDDKQIIQHSVLTDSGESIRIFSVDFAKSFTWSPDQFFQSFLRRCAVIPFSASETLWIPAHIHLDVPRTQAGDGNHFVLLEAKLSTQSVSVRDSFESLDYATVEKWMTSRLTSALSMFHSELMHDVWTVTNHEDPVLHQPNSQDCALHVLSWIASKLFGTEYSLPAIKQLRRILPVLLLAVCRAQFDIQIQN